jgi:hypothetical protein
MRFACLVSVCVIIVLAASVPAPAQPGGPPAPAQPPQVKRLADPLGRFTIEYPTLWTVNSHVVEPNKAGTVFSGFSGPTTTYVDVSLGEQAAPVTAEGFGRSVETQRRQQDASLRQLQDGATDIAGTPAYYVYYTVTTQGVSYYCLRVYLVIAAQRASPGTGTAYRMFWLDGGTRNDPRWVEPNVPLIQRIMWSFRPL